MTRNLVLIVAALIVTPAFASTDGQSSTSFLTGQVNRHKRELPVVQADAAAFIQKRSGMTALLKREIDAMRAELSAQAATLADDKERAALLSLTDAQLAAAILASSLK